MNPPIFVRGNVKIVIDGMEISHSSKPISVHGVTGLPWDPLEPASHFGKDVHVYVELTGEHKMKFDAPAVVTREHTAYGEYMGLRFDLKEQDQIQLKMQIKKGGFFPTEYVRKYPRIPANKKIKAYPMQILGTVVGEDMGPIIFSVENVSLGGVLVSSESPFAVTVIPGAKLNLSFEPRGDFSIQVKVQGTICRVFDEVSKPNGNIIRHFGVKFTRIDEDNRHAFLELLRDILQQIKDD